MTDDVTFTIEGWIATITLNRPQKLNAVTPEMAERHHAHTSSAATVTMRSGASSSRVPGNARSARDRISASSIATTRLELPQSAGLL